MFQSCRSHKKHYQYVNGKKYNPKSVDGKDFSRHSFVTALKKLIIFF